MAKALDSTVELEDVDGHAGFNPWRRRRSVRRRVRPGSKREKLWRGEWSRGTEGSLQGRLGGSGRSRGDGSDVGVLNQLGGIPPSSLGARGGRRHGEGVGLGRLGLALGVR